MFSVRWKLTLGLLGLTVLFIGLYVALAKRIFEEDKISYVFETQQNQIDSISENLRRDLEKAFFDLKTFAFLAAASGPSRDAALRDLFAGEAALLAIDGSRPGVVEPLFKFERTPGLLARAPKAATGDHREIRVLSPGIFAVSIPVPDQNQEWVILRGVFKINALPAMSYERQEMLLTDGATILERKGANAIAPKDLAELARESAGDAATITRAQEVGDRMWLVSRGSPVFGRFAAWVLTPQEEALGALRVLYQRSVVFVVFSFFAALLLALALSYTLTRNINQLTALARRVAGGDFSAKPDVRSRDEIGVLSKTFGTMLDEIQKLLQETAQKARMEAELKTARVVQDSLFPVKNEMQVGSIRLAGFYSTSSECGGDWWYYFQRGPKLHIVIADATGHGTPAALITSAARAVYSFAKERPLGLSEVATLLDHAIHQCSNGKLGMTAILLEIDTETGMATILNASHEEPVLLTPKDEGFSAEFLTAPRGSTLGEGRAVFGETSFQLEPGQRLVLWTDGITAILDQAGKTLGEKRLLRQFAQLSTKYRTASELSNGMYKDIHALGENLPLVDDVTLIVLENTKKRPS